jgi:hypothetical protein
MPPNACVDWGLTGWSRIDARLLFGRFRGKKRSARVTALSAEWT